VTDVLAMSLWMRPFERAWGEGGPDRVAGLGCALRQDEGVCNFLARSGSMMGR
jgi:hypothetical protein